MCRRLVCRHIVCCSKVDDCFLCQLIQQEVSGRDRVAVLATKAELATDSNEPQRSQRASRGRWIHHHRRKAQVTSGFSLPITDASSKCLGYRPESVSPIRRLGVWRIRSLIEPDATAVVRISVELRVPCGPGATAGTRGDG